MAMDLIIQREISANLVCDTAGGHGDGSEHLIVSVRDMPIEVLRQHRSSSFVRHTVTLCEVYCGILRLFEELIVRQALDNLGAGAAEVDRVLHDIADVVVVKHRSVVDDRLKIDHDGAAKI